VGLLIAAVVTGNVVVVVEVVDVVEVVEVGGTVVVVVDVVVVVEVVGLWRVLKDTGRYLSIASNWSSSLIV
jgi:hypothetical protein